MIPIMTAKILKKRVQDLLDLADIRIDGDRPWDLRVHNGKLFGRVLTQGALGLGESYMDGWWDCDDLDGFFQRLLEAGLQDRVSSKAAGFDSLKAVFLNLQRGARAFRVGEQHYDIGNDLFESMLDGRMIYSCGYWKEAATLDLAQENKLDLIGRKLGLKRGMLVLDVGCGWGGTAKFLSERYGVEVVGVTVSREQTSLARQSCEGLPVQIHLKDYREISGEFDRIFSIGMFEHVGVKNYRTYMRHMRHLLKEDGLFLLHTIGTNHPSRTINPWTSRYIFPNSCLPSPSQISRAMEGLFILEDWQNFGGDYDRTLMSWYRNFEKAWPFLKKRYGERFHRMWKYFLLSSAGSFRARWNQLWQLVLSPKGVPGVYPSPR